MVTLASLPIALVACTREKDSLNQQQVASLPAPKELIKAIIRGDEAEVDQLIQKGADVNARVISQSEEITPLFAAALHKNPRIIKKLIQAGADPQTKVKGYTAVDLAIYFEDDESAELLSYSAANALSKK